MESRKRRTESSRSWYTASRICLTVSFVCLAIAAQSVIFSSDDVTQRQRELQKLAGSTGAFLLLGALLSYDISRLNPAASHSYTSLFMHYAMVRVGLIWAKRFYNKLIQRCATVKQQQHDLLLDILTTNADTIYGKKFNFKNIKSYSDYKKCHPITTYEHFKTYIDMISDKGTKNVLTKLDPLYLAVSSGTTGKAKKIPLNGELMDIYMKIFPLAILMPLRKGLESNLCKSLRLWYEPKVADTPGGLKLSAIGYFLSAGATKLPYLLSDPIVFDVQQEDKAFYMNAVLSLRDRDVGHLEFTFASQLLDFWNYVLENIEDICRDIERGKLSEDLDIPLKMRVLLNRGMKPNKTRAREVMAEVQKGRNGLALRLWPCLQTARVIVTGSMQVYADSLRKTYMKGVAMLTLGHASTETIYGINISDDVSDYSYALAFDYSFFEFIPENACDKENPATLLAHELTVGSSYEIVVTTKMGLYRYRSGDIVTVVRYQQECPVYEFKYRLGQMLNVFWEKTSESVLQHSVLEAARELAVTVIDFTAAEDVYYHGIQGLKQMTRSYVLFIEIEGRKKLPKQKLEKFDEHLCKESEVYSQLRHNNSIGAMETLQVSSGTFHALAHAMNAAQHNPQFKMPRVMRTKDYLNFLKDRIL